MRLLVALDRPRDLGPAHIEVTADGTATVGEVARAIASCPESGLGELLVQGKLVDVLPGYRAAPMPVTLLYPNRRQLAKRARLFMLWLGEVMQPYVMVANK